jgi:hypothetical protein
MGRGPAYLGAVEPRERSQVAYNPRAKFARVIRSDAGAPPLLALYLCHVPQKTLHLLSVNFLPSADNGDTANACATKCTCVIVVLGWIALAASSGTTLEPTLSADAARPYTTAAAARCASSQSPNPLMQSMGESSPALTSVALLMLCLQADCSEQAGWAAPGPGCLPCRPAAPRSRGKRLRAQVGVSVPCRCMLVFSPPVGVSVFSGPATPPCQLGTLSA